MARTPFKLKSSPAKNKLQDFFNTIGSQLKSNKRDIGADLKSKYKGSKQTTNKAGEKIGYAVDYDLNPSNISASNLLGHTWRMKGNKTQADRAKDVHKNFGTKSQTQARVKELNEQYNPKKAEGKPTLNNKSDKKIKVKGAGTNSYNTKPPKAPKVKVNSGSLTSYLPSQKGDPFEYQVSDSEYTGEKNNYAILIDKGGKKSRRIIWYKDTRKGKDGEWEPTWDGDQNSKAILARYTGSETGDISKWVDNPWKSSTAGVQKVTNPDGGKASTYYGSQDKLESNSHLTYDQMQALNNPIEKKSPYKKGLGSYAKKAKGNRGYKMKRK